MILLNLYQGIFCKIKNLTSRDRKIFLEIDKIFKNIRQSTIIQANPIRKYKPVPEKKEWRPKYVQTPGPKRKRAQEKTETERIGSFLVYLWIKSQKLVIYQYNSTKLALICKFKTCFMKICQNSAREQRYNDFRFVRLHQKSKFCNWTSLSVFETRKWSDGTR